MVLGGGFGRSACAHRLAHVDRDQAIDDEIEYLTRRADVNAFVAFSSRIHVSAPTARRRDLDAHLVELFVQRGEAGNALQKGLALLRGGTLDDPAGVAPDVHIFTRSKLPWVTLPESVPAFDVYYDTKKLWPAASLERLDAIVASADSQA